MRDSRTPRPHVLVARLDNEGDVLLAGPAVRAVAAGAGRVTLLAGPRGRAAASLLPGVDEVRVFRAPWIDPEPEQVDPAAMAALVGDIAGLGVDEALILTSFHQSALPLALLLRLAGVPRVAAISEDYPGSLLDVRHCVPDDVHEVERGLSLAAAAGFELPGEDDGRLCIAASGPSPVEPPYVVVHPGASVPARAWEPWSAAALVAELARRGRRVVVTGAPAESPLAAFVAGSTGIDLSGRTSLAGLAAVLREADAVVCGNTGPAHLAAAVGTPVVSLHAPTVPAVRWRPWGVPHVVLGDQDIACAGCRARTCPVPGHPCLASVDPADVADAVESLARTRTAAG